MGRERSRRSEFSKLAVVFKFPQLAPFGEPDDDVQSDHMMECAVCGRIFDMRDLGQVFEHVHDGAEMPAAVLFTKP
jgi:hypothetical protein